MENKLISYFQKITPLSPAEINALNETMVVKKFSKNDYLAKEGQVGNDTFFVLEGCVRQFKLVDGNDISTNFFTEEEWIISSEAAEGKIPANYNLICMEDTSVVIGNEQKAQQLFRQFSRFETVSRQIMEAAYMEQQHRLAAYITDKPEQRYLRLMKTRPGLLQRVPQYDIATYIGVKPESLSRIRKKLQKKN